MVFIQYYAALAMTAVSYMVFLYLTSDKIKFKNTGFIRSLTIGISFLIGAVVGIHLLPASVFIITGQDMDLLHILVKEFLHQNNSPGVVGLFCLYISFSTISDLCEDLKNENGNYFGILLGLFTFTMANCIIWKLLVSTEILPIFILSLGISAYGFIRCHWARRAFRKIR